MLVFYPLLRAVVLVAALAGPEAAPPPPSLDDDVERHAALGERHLEHGRYQDAIAEFRRAYELRAEPKLLLGIADAYRLLGNVERASFFYERYLAAAPDDAPDRDEVERKIAELDRARAPAALAAPTDVGASPAGVRLDAERAQAEAAPAATPLWRRWWLWTAIGAVAVAGALTAVTLAGRGQAPAVPATDLGDKRFY